jgi:hypothetical protein
MEGERLRLALYVQWVINHLVNEFNMNSIPISMYWKLSVCNNRISTLKQTNNHIDTFTISNEASQYLY